MENITVSPCRHALGTRPSFCLADPTVVSTKQPRLAAHAHVLAVQNFFSQTLLGSELQK